MQLVTKTIIGRIIAIEMNTFIVTDYFIIDNRYN